MEKIFKGI